MGSANTTIILDRNAKDNLRLVIEHCLEQYLQTLAPAGTHAVLWRQHGYEKRVFFPVVIKPRGCRLTAAQQQQFRTNYTRYSHAFQTSELNKTTIEHSSAADPKYPSLAYFLFPRSLPSRLHEIRFESNGRHKKAGKKECLHLAVSIFSKEKPGRFPNGGLGKAADWLKQLEHTVDAWDNAEILWLSHMRPEGDFTSFDNAAKQRAYLAMITEVMDYACDRDPSPPFSSPLWWMEVQYRSQSLCALNPLYLSAKFSRIRECDEAVLADYSEQRHSEITKALGSPPHEKRDWDCLKLPNGRLVFRCQAAVSKDKLAEIASSFKVSVYEEVRDERTAGSLHLYGGVFESHYMETAKRVLEETAAAAERSFDAFERSLTRSDLDLLVPLFVDIKRKASTLFQNPKYHTPFLIKDHDAIALANIAADLHRQLIQGMHRCIQNNTSGETSHKLSTWTADKIRHVLISLKALSNSQHCGTYLLQMWICLLNNQKFISDCIFVDADYKYDLELPDGITNLTLFKSLLMMHEEGAKNFTLKLDPRAANWTIAITIPAKRNSGLGILARAFDFGRNEGNLRKALEPWLRVIEERNTESDFSIKIDGQFGNSWTDNSLAVSFHGKLISYHNEPKRLTEKPLLQPKHDSFETIEQTQAKLSAVTAPPGDNASAPRTLAVCVIDHTFPTCTRKWPADWFLFSNLHELANAMTAAPTTRYVLTCHLSNPRDRDDCLHHKSCNIGCVCVVFVTGGNPDAWRQNDGSFYQYLAVGDDESASLSMEALQCFVTSLFNGATELPRT